MVRTFLSGSLAMLLGLSAATALAQEGRKLAIVVGVEKYADPEITPLKFAGVDSEKMYQTLIEFCGFSDEHIVLLNDKGGKVGLRAREGKLAFDEALAAAADFYPTRTNVLKQTRDLLLQVALKDDLVVIFFSGHGFLADNNNEEGILATKDCFKANKTGTGLKISALREMLEKCPARRKILILDCCHAGAKGEQVAPDDVQELFKNAQGLITLASCDANQESHEPHELGQGLFTHYLIRGLKGDGDTNVDGRIELEELFKYVQSKVYVYSRDNLGRAQTPVKFESNAAGFFELARVKGFVPKPPVRLEAPGRQIAGAPPDKRFREIFERFRSGVSAPEGDSMGLLADATALIAEARQLRTSQLKGPSTLSTRNPFFTDNRTGDVYEWMQAVRTGIDKQRLPATELTQERLQSFKVSLALSAWHKPQKDQETAAQLLSELYPFELTSEDPSVRGHLLLAHAQTRPGDPQGLAEALRSYSQFLELSEEQFRKQGIDVPPSDLHDDVLAPSLLIAAKVANDPQWKPLAAKVQGMHGQVVARHAHIFSDPNIRQAAKSNLQEAMKLDAKNPAHRCNLATLLLMDASRSSDALNQVRSLAQEAQKLGGQDPLVSLVSRRLEGETWYRESLLDKSASRRLELARAAYNSFSEALKSSLKPLEPQPGLHKQGSIHKADALIGRSAALVLQANYEPNGEYIDSLLQQAIKDAEEAVKTNDARTQYYAYTAWAHALEDRAWLGSHLPQVIREKDFEGAMVAFSLAEQKRDYSPEPRIGLARCLYKAELFAGRKGGVQDALRELDHVRQTFSGDQIAMADVHCLTAKSYESMGDLVRADEEYRNAWALLSSKGLGEEPLRKTACLYDWGCCSLLQTHQLLMKGDSAGVKQWTGIANFCAGVLKGLDEVRANLLQAEALGYQAKVASGEDVKRLQSQALDLYNKTEKLPGLSQQFRFEIFFNRAWLKRDLGQKDIATIEDFGSAWRAALKPEEKAASRVGDAITRMDMFLSLNRQSPREAAPYRDEAIRQLGQAIGEAPAHPDVPEWRLRLAAWLLAVVPPAERNRRSDEIKQLLSQGMAAGVPSLTNDFAAQKARFNKTFPDKAF
jgi:uncharacterized caspase-like protein